MPNYLCHERFWNQDFDLWVVCIYSMWQSQPEQGQHVFQKQCYFSYFESGLSEARVASRKTLSLLLRNIQTSWISTTLW